MSGARQSPSRLLGAPMVTPYDIYRAYRDQNEKVSAKLVEVPVDKFLAKVPEPSEAEIQAFYDKYKDTLPDPTRSTPGFKVPRQVRVEILSVDGNALARSLKDGLTDAELRAAYENRKSEFEVKGGPTDLPADLFAGHPELTPPIIQPFNEVRSILGNSLAEEKAQSEIVERFGKIKRDVLDKYFDDYQEALSIQEEAKRQADSGTASLPEPPDLKELAKREKLEYERTPMLSREDAEKLGSLSAPRSGCRGNAIAPGEASPMNSSTPRRGYSSRSSSPTTSAHGISPGRPRMSRPASLPWKRSVSRSPWRGGWRRPARWPARPPTSWPSSSRSSPPRSRTGRFRATGS